VALSAAGQGGRAGAGASAGGRARARLQGGRSRGRAAGAGGRGRTSAHLVGGGSLMDEAQGEGEVGELELPLPSRGAFDVGVAGVPAYGVYDVWGCISA